MFDITLPRATEWDVRDRVRAAYPAILGKPHPLLSGIDGAVTAFAPVVANPAAVADRLGAAIDADPAGDHSALAAEVVEQLREIARDQQVAAWLQTAAADRRLQKQDDASRSAVRDLKPEFDKAARTLARIVGKIDGDLAPLFDHEQAHAAGITGDTVTEARSLVERLAAFAGIVRAPESDLPFELRSLLVIVEPAAVEPTVRVGYTPVNTETADTSIEDAHCDLVGRHGRGDDGTTLPVPVVLAKVARGDYPALRLALAADHDQTRERARRWAAGITTYMEQSAEDAARRVAEVRPHGIVLS